MNTNLNVNIYNADLYLRLSKEDGDKEESDSIVNQRSLILDYLSSKPDIQIHKIRVDDGYSGVNFERPAFQQMLEDIKKGEVNCVITKDLSRFGRNHIETGKYIEKVFPYLGVRFIAINDNYDSLQNNSQNNMIIPFKNLINDAYCRDISIKIRTNLEVKRKNGDFVGAFAPYGYRKSKDNKNRLEIDEEAAIVVDQIFKWYLQGNSIYRIAQKLNEEEIKTPMDYKRSSGSSFYTGFKKTQAGKWSHVMVMRILSNPVYTGTLVQGKDTTPNYKVKKRIRRDEKEWNCVENTHDSIVSFLTFNNVQELLHMDTRTGNSEETIYCLAGVVKCGDCGAAMIRKTVPSGKKRYIYYVCGNHKGNRHICSTHSIRADVLENSILKLINVHIKYLMDIETVLKNADNERRRKGVKGWKRQQIQKKKEELEWNYHLKLELYEDFKTGIITREEYAELKDVYENRIREAEKVLCKLNDEMEELDNGNSTYMEWLHELKEYRNLKTLSRTAVVLLIDDVLIYEKKSGEKYPRIEVHFKYEQESESALGTLKIEDNEIILNNILNENQKGEADGKNK